jgi:hypothetical protein
MSAEPRRADERRPCSRIRSSLNNIRLSRYSDRMTELLLIVAMTVAKHYAILLAHRA